VSDAKTAEFTIGDWDLELNVVYIPYYDRFDDWRKCVWNPKVLCDVDIVSILVTCDHINSGEPHSRWVDFDKLKEVKQEKIMENIMEMDEK